MLRYIEIIGSSLKMALQEFRSNKMRTFLSLLGITFGIFCIISVISTISSMEAAIQNDLKSLGSNTAIFIDKWEYRDDNNYPWWKFVKRPVPKYEEMKLLKANVPQLATAVYFTSTNSTIEYGDNILSGVNYDGITEDFAVSQKLDIGYGRFLQQNEFDRGTNSIVIGYSIAEKLFIKPEKAVGKVVRLKDGKLAVVIGVFAKQGQSMINIWDYDNSIFMAYSFIKQMVTYGQANANIMVEGKPNVSLAEFKDELTGTMRAIRKLSPTEEDNYALNDVATFSNNIHELFGNITLGGWAITALSLIVGMFGVANIMFVTVRERTSQIGLKKAIGAKRGTIMTEFLLESAFLCIIGGLIGLIAVFILTQIFSAMFSFKVFISIDTIFFAIGICLTVGVLAGIVPAYIAAKMDPVVAIRSK
ncbi:MAG: ABC transporter permease [Bacteroidetes bacterium]|nr:ABC transporter permease [Bacteroidota bacterium]